MVLINEGLSVAEITPLPLVSKELRPIGLCKGQVFITDDFDDPLPEDFLLQPFPEDFDDRFEAAQKRARDSHGR